LPTIPLGFPQDLAKALHDPMLRCMLGIESLRKNTGDVPNAWRLID
jgi:hypothetical protein